MQIPTHLKKIMGMQVSLTLPKNKFKFYTFISTFVSFFNKKIGKINFVNSFDLNFFHDKYDFK